MSTDDPTALTPAQEKQLSEGVQLQFAAQRLFETLISLPIPPKLALGALAACSGEFLFRLHSDPRVRISNRMAFEKATRDTLKALEAVEKDGVAGAMKGLAELEADERFKTTRLAGGPIGGAMAGASPLPDNVVQLKPKD